MKDVFKVSELLRSMTHHQERREMLRETATHMRWATVNCGIDMRSELIELDKEILQETLQIQALIDDINKD